jgi:hypothetical protein
VTGLDGVADGRFVRVEERDRVALGRATRRGTAAPEVEVGEKEVHRAGKERGEGKG